MAESATMALLKGNKGKSKTNVDDELAAAPDKITQDQADAETAETGDEPDTVDTDNEDGTVTAAPDTTDDEAEADSADASIDGTDQHLEEPEAAGVAIPTSKTEVHALKMAELPGVHEAMGSPIEGFDALGLKEKKQALLDYLFPAKGKAKVSVGESDTLTAISAEIENLKTRADVEQRLGEIAQIEGENFFRKGGLLVKLSELGDFGEHNNFQDYVKANGIAPDYRTARYWMSIYTGLLEAGIPYADVQGVGWTKIVVLIPVLTKENVADWVVKAKAMNVATLKATVDAELATDDSGKVSDSAPKGDIKSMVFKLHADQTDTVNDALAKAKKNANTESKEVALDLICVEFLGNAGNKPLPAAAPAKVVGYDTDNLDIVAFLSAVHDKFPDPKDAMGFLFGELPDAENGESQFEKLWPKIDLDLNIPD